MIKEINNNKGITLIALVITIIVLLILAGVSISMLSGENGILRQATRAREETEQESIRENIRLAEIEARMNDKDGNLTKDELQSTLNRYFGEGKATIEEKENDDGTKNWTVIVEGVEELIEGSIEEEKKVITAAEMYDNQIKYYGEKVDYEIDINGDGKTTDDWEIFYVGDYKGEIEANSSMTNKPEEGKRIFLIASDCVGKECEALTKSSTGAKIKSGMMSGIRIQKLQLLLG